MKSFRICIQNIRKWNSNPRIWMTFILALLFSYLYTKGLSVACEYVEEDMSPWLYPFLFTYRYMKIIFMFPVVFIFCDAPFIDENQPYVMLRTRRITWSIGQVMYIYAGSFLYMLFLVLSSVIVNIGHIKMTASWGEVLGLCGSTNILSQAGVNYGTVKVMGSIIKYFTPLQAMFFSCLLTWMGFVITGLVIYAFNVITNTRYVGVAIASFLILLTAVVDGNGKMTWYSPISWNSLNNIDVGGMSSYPDIDYVMGMYMLLIIILTILSVIAGKRQSVEVRMAS